MAREMVCKQCGVVGNAVRRPPGSFVGELAVWCGGLLVSLLAGWWVMLLPLGFSLYRMIATVRRCKQCDSAELVPPDSPVGRELMSRYAAPSVSRGLPAFPPSRQPNMIQGPDDADR
jgi:hypothetical protein